MDPSTLNAFFEEIEKIAQEERNVQPDNVITPERFKRFLGAATVGAIGTGLGYGVGRLVGRPLEEKMLEMGVKHGPAKVLRYGLPTAAGLGAALSLAKLNLRSKLFEKVRGENKQRDIRTEQQSG